MKRAIGLGRSKSIFLTAKAVRNDNRIQGLKPTMFLNYDAALKRRSSTEDGRDLHCGAEGAALRGSLFACGMTLGSAQVPREV